MTTIESNFIHLLGKLLAWPLEKELRFYLKYQGFKENQSLRYFVVAIIGLILSLVNMLMILSNKINL
jgi:uncharacterized Tic20 family protein